MTVAAGSTRRPTILINPYDASTVALLSIVMPDGTASPLTLTGPVAQGGGAGLWTANAPYTLSLPGRWYERFTVTNAVTGLGAGASSVAVDVDPTPPPAGIAGAWATLTQYVSMIGGTVPTNIGQLLYRATLQLRPHVSGSLYDTSDAPTLLALAQACCLQVAYAQENGWTTGSPSIVQTGQIGSMRIDPPRRNDGGAAADPLPGISPLAAEVLEAAGLLYAAPATDLGWWSLA
jgi:hypothetical protein